MSEWVSSLQTAAAQTDEYGSRQKKKKKRGNPFDVRSQEADLQN